MPYQPITRGVICPTVTPLKSDGGINPEMIRPLVDFLIGKGRGRDLSAWEAPARGRSSATEERKAIAAATVEAVAGRVPVIVHYRRHQHGRDG